MPASMVRRFADPDEYGHGIRATNVEISVIRPGHFQAKLVRIDLHQLWLQRVDETLPRIAHYENSSERVFLSFAAGTNPPISMAGVEMSPGMVLLNRLGGSGFQRTNGPITYAGMSLKLADMQHLGAGFTGAGYTPREDAFLTPPDAAFRRLQQLHQEAGELAETAPEVLAHPEAAHGLEQALLVAMAECLVRTGGYIRV